MPGAGKDYCEWEIFESGKRDQGGVSGNETCVALSFESPWSIKYFRNI